MEINIFGHTLSFRKASKKELSSLNAYSYAGVSPLIFSRDSAMQLSAVYRCVEVKSDDIGSLPLKIYKKGADGFKQEAFDHPLSRILNIEPNVDMSRFTFFKTMQAAVDLQGNAYAYIQRDPLNRVEQLVYIPSAAVSVEFVTDGNGVRRKYYRVQGLQKLVNPRDILHFLNFSYDGVIGVSTLTHAKHTIGIAESSEDHASGFFHGGGNVSGILTVEGRQLSKEQKDQIYETWASRVGAASGASGGIAVLEGNMKYQPIAVSPKDSQLIESRLFNVGDICRFFGVSPIKCFDLSKSSYSTVEAMQLQHLSDTLAPLVAKFEAELNRKLLLPSEQSMYSIEFDTTALLRTDKTAEAKYLQTMFNIGAITINEIRQKNNLPRLEGGDTPFVPVNLQTLSQATSAPSEAPSGEM